MRMATCTLPEGGTIVVQTAHASRVFRGGERVDLDATAAAAHGDRPAASWADVLGHHVGDHFTIETPARASRRAAAEPPVAGHEE